MNSPSSSANTFQPMRMCRDSESDLYWVAMKMRRKPEFTQLDSVKSMMRYGPAEVDGRLGPFLGQREQALADASGQDDHQRIGRHTARMIPRGPASPRPQLPRCQ